MPITEKLNNIRSLKEFIHNENNNLRNELKLLVTEKNNSLSDKISGLEVSMATSQKDLLIKILGIIVGTVGVAVTIRKLFP